MFPPSLVGDKGTLEAQQGPADTAFAERSGAGGRARTRFPQAADFIGNVSARQGGGKSCKMHVTHAPIPAFPRKRGKEHVRERAA